MDRSVNEYLRKCPEEVQRHCQRTGELMESLFCEMNRESEIALCRLNGCSPFYYHDIGKCIVPKKLLEKDSALNIGEWTIMKRHTRFGGILFDQLRELAESPEARAFCRVGAMVCKYHHERWDGSGYPMGLEGAAIPFVARVCAVADSWDAMVSQRCYRGSLTEHEALTEIEKGSGTQFDPEIVAAFLEVKNVIHSKSIRCFSVE